MKFVMLKKRPVPTGWEYTGSSARRRDVSETVCCRSSPCASRWSLTFWGLRSVPGDMFTLSVKPKGTLKSRPALLAAVFTYGHMLRCSLELGGGGGLQLLSLLPAAWPAGTPSLPGQEHQRSWNQPPSTCPSAGSAHATRSLCTGWVGRARSFATKAFHCVAPKAVRLCSAGGFACPAHTRPTQRRWGYLRAPPKSLTGRVTLPPSLRSLLMESKVTPRPWM